MKSCIQLGLRVPALQQGLGLNSKPHQELNSLDLAYLEIASVQCC